MQFRHLAAALVLALLLVPAATRASQALHATRQSTPVPSFTKSVDVPPEPVVAVPDLTCAPREAEPRIQIVARAVPAPHDPVPSSPPVSDGLSVRAPPARLFG